MSPANAPAQVLPLTFPCTAEELADFLKVTPRTVNRFAKNLVIQAFRIGPGGDWRFTQAAVEDFILRNSNWAADRSRSPRLGRKKVEAAA